MLFKPNLLVSLGTMTCQNSQAQMSTRLVSEVLYDVSMQYHLDFERKCFLNMRLHILFFLLAILRGCQAPLSWNRLYYCSLWRSNLGVGDSHKGEEAVGISPDLWRFCKILTSGIPCCFSFTTSRSLYPKFTKISQGTWSFRYYYGHKNSRTNWTNLSCWSLKKCDIERFLEHL